MALSPINRRRWQNFRTNRRAYWSLWIFGILFGLSLFAELIANDKPLLVKYQGEYYTPIFNFYSEQAFGGDLRTEANYRTQEVECLIATGGSIDCFDFPVELIEDAQDGEIAGQQIDRGWTIWPIVPYSFDTPNNLGRAAPSPSYIGYLLDQSDVYRTVTSNMNYYLGLSSKTPAEQMAEPREPKPISIHWLGTDDTTRDVLARVIYGFRLSVLFALIVTAASSVIGVIAGAVQGYFGGWVDLLFQRFLEIFGAIPNLYVIIIMTAILGRSFWLLVGLSILFGWPALTGLIRAEFFRARNFEYVRAAQALGVSNWTVMMRHILPNAMVATVTFLPFIITGAIAGLATLDFLGYGLPTSQPSLGELTRQAKENLQALHLGFTAFFVFAIMLSLLVFIFEGIRDAFDPRKVYQ